MSSWAEVVEPSTRALVDEDSEDELLQGQQAQTLTCLELKWVEENTSEIDLFIIVYGKLSTSFVKRFVCEEHHDIIAEVQESQLKDVAEKEPLPATQKSVSQIYQLNKNTCICLCADIEMNNANKFRNAILPLIQKSSQIVVVSSHKSSSFLYDKAGVDFIVPFVRCLHSSTFKLEKNDVPYLEQPNIVTGVPAAILSWCEVFNVPGILYSCYSDTDEVNSISTDPLVKLFSGLPTKVLDPSKVQFKKESYGPVTTTLYL